MDRWLVSVLMRLIVWLVYLKMLVGIRFRLRLLRVAWVVRVCVRLCLFWMVGLLRLLSILVRRR